MKKRVISMVLTGVLAGTALCSCTQGEQKSNNEEVVLNWIMPGPGVQQDSELVWEEFNKQLKTYEGLENVSVNFNVINASDYSQKFLMAQTSGDAMDIIQTYTLDFVKEARNGSFASVDEYFKDELKETKEELPDFIMKYGEVDGKVYSITNYQMCPGMWALNIKKEVADKYLDINRVKEILSEPGYSEELFNILEEFLKSAKDNGELGVGFRPNWSKMLGIRGYDNILADIGVNVYSDKPEVKMIFDIPEYKNIYERMSKWFKSGYIRKDILSVSDMDAEVNKTDGYIMYIANTYDGEEIRPNAKTGQEFYSIYIESHPIIPTRNSAGSLAISVGSKNKSEAARVINLMNTKKGKDLYNLLVYGIEGIHYNKVSEDRIETIGYTRQGTSSSPYGLWKWIVGNTKNAYETQADKEGYKDFMFNDFNEGEDTVQSPCLGFKADTTLLETDISQMNTIIKEYSDPLSFGVSEDYEAVYNEYMAKLKSCNGEKVRDEIQKQLDEFLSSKK